jgi:hypothetical protein
VFLDDDLGLVLQDSVDWMATGQTVAMTKQADSRPRRRAWHLLLLALVILPFLPELTIYAVRALAKLNGCAPDAPDNSGACFLANLLMGDIVEGALQVALFVSLGFGIGFVAIWLALCYCTINRGWSRLSSRLLLAFVACAAFAIPPYLAPNFALAPLTSPENPLPNLKNSNPLTSPENPLPNPKNSRCQAQGGRFKSCFIFGGDVTDTANDVGDMATTAFPPAVAIAQTFHFAANFISQKPLGPAVMGLPIAIGTFSVYLILTIVGGMVSRRRKFGAGTR